MSFVRDDEDSQSRHYKLLSDLQQECPKLPLQIQQRLSSSLLSDIASSLLDSAIFVIVADLQEIQHLTEKSLFNQRQKLQVQHRAIRQELETRHEDEKRSCRPHNRSVLNSQHSAAVSSLKRRLQKEVSELDRRLFNEIEQKVTAQQATLQSANVPGFFVTSEPEEIRLQMAILTLIKNLSNK